MSTRIRHLPVRFATGAFILNAGVGKLRADEPTATQVHGFAAGAYPFVRSLPPGAFVRMVGAAEVALGAALIAPVVPTALVAVGLTAFSSGLLGIYARVPALREPGSLRPSRLGVPVAKDVWLLGIGLSLLLDEISDHREAGPGAGRSGRLCAPHT